MTTGNTSLLGLALPVEGELDGTWGDVVNDSITSLVDSAVAGTTTLSVDADVTLTTTVLAANQARQAIIRWTASNGATTRNITAPAQSKPYIVINAGTGSIVLRGAGPTTGVTIVAGERCLAAWSGSDFVKIATSTAATLNGTETLTNKTIEFVDGTAAAPSITNVGDTNTGIFFPAADVIAFAEGGAEAARFDASGFFGLGTTSPVAKFDLAGDYKEGVITANTGTAYTISTATGTLQILTLTGNCTFTFPTATTGESFTLFLRQDGTGGRTVTWPANVRWPGGTAPTITSTASRQDKYIFTADGTNWYGSNAGQNYTV